MEKLPTAAEIKDQIRHLLALLDDPRPGLKTRWTMRNEAAGKLHDMLGLALGRIAHSELRMLRRMDDHNWCEPKQPKEE